MSKEFKLNDEQSLAVMLTNMGHNVMIIGPAGTGKSVVIDTLRKKNGTVVLAPTARAATNVSGSTIHSYFGFNHAIQTEKTFARNLAGKDKPSRIIIDEFFMVRADIIEAIDRELKRVFKSEEPFAGIQMIIVGDYFQLQPIVVFKEATQYYKLFNSPYAFSSEALQNGNFSTVKLTQVIRQDDPQQSRLLESIRVKDKYWKHAVTRLNQWCKPYDEEEHGSYIQLCFYNVDVNNKNNAEFDKLPEEIRTFRGKRNGEFDDLPVPSSLLLKKGCRIVICANGVSEVNGKVVGKYFNGMTGTLKDIKPTYLLITLDSGKDFRLSRHTWQNITYEKGTEKILGEYRQYPIKLGYAVSVHSSQGMTLDRYVLDTGRGAFADALVYVGLSRARDLKNVVLKEPLRNSDVRVSEEVLKYHNSI